MQAVVKNGTFGDLEDQTNALQVILDCFISKSSLWQKLKHSTAGGNASIPAKEEREDGAEKEKVTKNLN